jgi:hypothetical protein
MVPRREFKMWNANYSSSHTKGEADCGESNLHIFKATMNHNGTPPPIPKELQELREYSRKISEPANTRRDLLSKLKSQWSKKRTFKKGKSLHRQIETYKGDVYILATYIEVSDKAREALKLEVENIREQCKGAATLETHFGRGHTKETGNRNATGNSENCYQTELNTWN